MALDFGKLNFSTSFNPTSAFPIDARSYFESLAAAQEAASKAEAAGSSNTTYYFGQILTVNEGGAVAAYQITNAKALQKLASTTSSGDLAADVATLQSKVGALETAVNTTIPATYETKANVSALGERVTTAEGEIDTLQTSVTAVEGNVSTLQTTVGEHTTSISGLQTNVSALQTTVGNAGSGLVKDVNDLKSQIGGVTGALHFKGVVAELPVDLSTYSEGDVILVDNKEYVCNDEDGTKSWVELGDEGSYALKTTTVNDKPLSANITLTATDVKADPAGTAAGLIAALDVAEVAVNANETVATISETDGKIAVGKQAIQIAQSQVTGLETALAGKADAADIPETIVETVSSSDFNVSGTDTVLINLKSSDSPIAQQLVKSTNGQTLIFGGSISANGTILTGNTGTVQSITAGAGLTTGGDPITATGTISLKEIGSQTTSNEGNTYIQNITTDNYGRVTDVTSAAVPSYSAAAGGGLSLSGNKFSIAANGILTSMIADGAVTTAKIAANAVTSDKIASVSTDAFVQGDNELVLDGGTSAD